MKKTMECKSDAMEFIREAANRHGFEFVDDRWGASIKDGLDWNNAWVNFTIHEDVGAYDAEELSCEFFLSVTASPSRMGGNTTPEDLREAADHLSRAADLVEELSSITLVYKRYIKK